MSLVSHFKVSKYLEFFFLKVLPSESYSFDITGNKFTYLTEADETLITICVVSRGHSRMGGEIKI